MLFVRLVKCLTCKCLTAKWLEHGPSQEIRVITIQNRKVRLFQWHLRLFRKYLQNDPNKQAIISRGFLFLETNCKNIYFTLLLFSHDKNLQEKKWTIDHLKRKLKMKYIDLGYELIWWKEGNIKDIGHKVNSESQGRQLLRAYSSSAILINHHPKDLSCSLSAPFVRYSLCCEVIDHKIFLSDFTLICTNFVGGLSFPCAPWFFHAE